MSESPFYGLSKEERLKAYAKDHKRNKYKEAIDCLMDVDCRECASKDICSFIATRLKLGWTKDMIGNWVKPKTETKKGGR
jgi:hypothetical protein